MREYKKNIQRIQIQKPKDDDDQGSENEAKL